MKLEHFINGMRHNFVELEVVNDFKGSGHNTTVFKINESTYLNITGNGELVIEALITHDLVTSVGKQGKTKQLINTIKTMTELLGDLDNTKMISLFDTIELFRLGNGLTASLDGCEYVAATKDNIFQYRIHVEHN